MSQGTNYQAEAQLQAENIISAEKREIRSQIIQLQIKYNYFIMGLSTAAIAFAIQQTTHAVWSCAMWLWCGAVLMWAGSIGLGLVYERNNMMRYRKAFFPDDSEEKISKQLGGATILSLWLFRIQHLFLVLGTVLFITWHIGKMTVK